MGSRCDRILSHRETELRSYSHVVDKDTLSANSHLANIWMQVDTNGLSLARCRGLTVDRLRANLTITSGTQKRPHILRAMVRL